MSLPWKSLDFKSTWTGLFSRRQTVDVPPDFASVARNVDFYGSAIAKRQGTQLVNGWGTLTSGDWVNSGGVASGHVQDASGFEAFDPVIVVNPDGSGSSGTIASIVGTLITLQGTLGTLPVLNGCLLAKRGNVGVLNARIDGLFHAVFRNGAEYLLAASTAFLWNYWAVAVNGGASYFPIALTEAFPGSTINGTWAGTTVGNLTSTESLVAVDFSTKGGPAGTSPNLPDVIRIIHSGNVIYEGLIASISGNQVTLAGVASQAPQNGDTVRFFPSRTAGDTRFLQHANLTHIASASAPHPPPVKMLANGTIQRHGIKPPTTAPVANDSGSAGLLNGSYASWRVKFRNSTTGAESEPGPASNPITLTNHSAALTALPVSLDPQVDKKRIYRPHASENGVWYFIAEVPNAQTTFTDNVGDASLIDQMRELLDEVVPDTVSLFAYWPTANRLLAIDQANQFVLYSDAANVLDGTLKDESWPFDNILFVNRDDGDPLVAIIPFYDSVLIFKEHSTWRCTGTPPALLLEPIFFRDDQSGVGTFSAKAPVIDQDELMFPGEDGFYSLSRYDGMQQGFQSQRISRVIDDEWVPRLVQGSVNKMHGVYHRPSRKLRLFAAVDGNPTGEPNEEFVFQFEGTPDGSPHGWALWDPPPIPLNAGDAPNVWSRDTTASCIVRKANATAVTYYGTASGLVLRDDPSGADTGGLAIRFEYETVWFAPAGIGRPGRSRALDLAMKVLASVNLTLALATDFAGPDFIPIHADPKGGAIWGTAVWGQGQWGIPTSVRLGDTVMTLGEYHRIGFLENSPTAQFQIQAFSYWFQGLPPGAADRTFTQGFAA